MKSVAIALVAMFAAPAAFAASLPIVGAYGDEYGCKVAKAGGAPVAGEPADWMLVTTRDAEGREWSCSLVSARGDRVVASCANGGDTKSTRQSVTLREDRAAGTLTYTDRAGTFILHRCR